MKKNNIKLLCTGLMLSTALLAGCGKDKEKTTETTTEASIVLDSGSDMSTSSGIDMAPTREGYVISELTGEWIDESLENQRPLCIMINNIIDAMPQSGISQADITYEMLVEGSITRYLCVFKDYSNLNKLGPVRSARPYYVQMSHMMGGLYAHYGWNSFAEEQINLLGVNNMNGIEGVGNVLYYRDESRYAPHNVYTNTDMINSGIDYMGYSKEYNDGFEKTFAFQLEDTDLATGNIANKVTVPFNAYYIPWFEYDSSAKLYKRFQYDDVQTDEQTGEQLAYKNIIAIYVPYADVWDGLLQVDWTSGGTGYYISNGEYMPMTWKKENGYVKYYDQTGKQLKMNPGKTFVEVMDTGSSMDLEFE